MSVQALSSLFGASGQEPDQLGTYIGPLLQVSPLLAICIWFIYWLIQRRDEDRKRELERIIASEQAYRQLFEHERDLRIKAEQRGDAAQERADLVMQSFGEVGNRLLQGLRQAVDK